MARRGAVLVLLALLGAGQAGCGDDKSTDREAPQAKPGMGETVTIPRIGTPKLEVTVLQLFDPVEGATSDKPHKGNRFIGIRFNIKNVGTEDYVDAPARGADLITNDNRDTALADLTAGECSDGLGFGVTIKPGDAKDICQPFEAKQTLAPKTFLFTLGTLPESGEWSLR
jgi:uncharacterized protein DUF4352